MSKTIYDKEPHVAVDGYDSKAWNGYDAIFGQLRSDIERLAKSKVVIALDCYHGVDESEVLNAFIDFLDPVLTIKTDSVTLGKKHIELMLQENITDDRVFGRMSSAEIAEFFDNGKLKEVRESISAIAKGIILVYGIGASLIEHADILIYADMARWEIQKRMRDGRVGNWLAENESEDFLRKYKRAFFIDWRVIDRYKVTLFENIDYLLDTNLYLSPKMISRQAFLKALEIAASKPFRVVPFFDPGPWGGQWMKDKFDLDDNVPNYAWCFDCVPEENSLYLKFGDVRVEVPAMDLVLMQPKKLLGEYIYNRFGAEFPIRFDFLDTMDGGNLSLQVHPLTDYIRQTFGMRYTQDESYYMLDAQSDACVYLGLKNGVDKDALIADLVRAQEGEIQFDAKKYIAVWPAAKHDHFLIPGGTIHCSGRNSMVLEISATPYIFTFKLWDWGRLGMDGLPRPIHLEHGKQVIQWDRTEDWTRTNLVNRIEKVGEGDGWVEERTGLHEREFIETRRHWFNKQVTHDTCGNLNVLNLVEGDEAIITSPDNEFEPFIVHYAETFIIPGCIGKYVISPYGGSIGKCIATIKAYVRNQKE